MSSHELLRWFQIPLIILLAVTSIGFLVCKRRTLDKAAKVFLTLFVTSFLVLCIDLYALLALGG